jgi:hypothetical protein
MITHAPRTGIGMKKPLSALLTAGIAGLSCVLVGCSASTEVSLTGNTPAQYSHMWVTTQELWFNSSATAGPDDSGWYKFTLSTPTTIDVVAEGGGNLASITSGLQIIPGTYSQVRLIPVDPSTPLTTSAQTAGALYNSEADYVDASGVTHQLPLEFLNPDKGIGIATALKVPLGNIGAALTSGAAGTTAGTSTGTTTDTTTGTTTGAVVGIGATGTTTGTTGTTTTTPNEFAVTEDGTTDLVPFTYGNATGIMLSSHASAYDLSQSGGISGELTLTNITTSTSGQPAIQVSAQVLSTDGTRHVVVATTTVQADGTFLLYPLAASTNGTWYDVVIHGPGIATIIIKSVEVQLPSSSNSLSSTDSTTDSTTTTTIPATTTTTPSTTTTSTGTTNGSANNVVAIGTLTPRAASSYTANLATSAATKLPAGAAVGFYQTLATSGSVPYVIESSPIDPFNQVLFNAQTLSEATIDSGTWSSSGAALTVVSAAPAEGAGVYIVSPYAPAYGDAALTTTIKAPAAPAAGSPSTATPAPVTVVVPALPLASGTASGSLRASVQAPAGKYTTGELLVSSNGALVGSASLGSNLASGSASVTVSGLPADVPSAVYYVSVRAWNASEPAETLLRQWYPQSIDMRAATSGSIAVTID